jgi:hypothetical protein
VNTAKIHVRFWNAMSERYGRRWTEQYGAEASPAWRELVNKFTIDDVKAALSKLSTEAPDFPPTLPQFEAILAKAANAKRSDTTDYIRGAWRAYVIRQVGINLGLDWDTLEATVIANKQTLGIAMRDVMDQFDTIEKNTGQRTDGMLTACRDKCAQLTDRFQHLEAPGCFGARMRQFRGRPA